MRWLYKGPPSSLGGIELRKDRINYDIEPDLLEFVKDYVKETNLSRNQVISLALREWVEKQKEEKK